MKSNKFKIIIPSYNNSEWVEYNIASVLNQIYTNYEVLYIDDGSDDNTYDKALSIIKDDNRWKIIKRDENKGGTYNYFFGESIDFLGSDEDVIVHLDGDDWLFDEEVLKNLNEFYISRNVWMTYGKFYCYTGSDKIAEAYPQNTPHPDFVIENKLFRRDTWRASHMRTYKTFLYKKLDLNDLYSKIDGKLFWHAADLAFQFPFLEMCPKDKIGVLDFPSYVYNQAPKNQERTKERERLEHSVYEQEIRNRESYKEISK
jgi:glycosyltransferase involved in cell wall biosynthesis